MDIGAYGILFIFGAFILLMILNPKLSCFGRRIKSPLYPLLRKRHQAARKPPQTEDYGFVLGSKGAAVQRPRPSIPAGKKVRTEDYGFKLQTPEKENPSPETPGGPEKKGSD